MIGRSHLSYVLLSSASALALSVGSAAYAGPQGGQVVGGSATISSAGNRVDITQHTNRAIIDWRSFDIEVGEHTQFHQPSSSATALNRVKSQDPSRIMGSLSANGNVVLVNPNGVFFGTNSRVDVNSLVATTADIDNNDFMAGRMNFTRPGNAGASIVNEGTITARDAGLVGLVAPQVENHGVINARMGRVELASGDSAVIDLYGDGLLGVEVSDAVSTQLIKNTGRISAEGGTIAITAAQGRNIVDSLVSISGEVAAPSVAQKNGKIIIAAPDSFVSTGGTIAANGAQGGSIDITANTLSLAENITAKGTSGKGGNITIAANDRVVEFNSSVVDASGVTEGGSIRSVADGHMILSGNYTARAAHGKGGNIDITARTIAGLSPDIDASGATIGGRVRIGGEFQGGKHLPTDELPNAQAVLLNNGTRIRATGGVEGGRTIVWSEQSSRVYGSIDVSQQRGTRGGFVELSSADTLTYRADVNTGPGGQLLLDPKNITIDTASGGVFDQNFVLFGSGFSGGNNRDVDNLGGSDNFGTSVSLDSNRLAVGAEEGNGFSNSVARSGEVYLFSFSDADFNGGTLEAIIGDGYTGGKNIDVTLGVFDNFGASVSLDGNRLAVGAREGDGFNNSVSNSGDVYLFSFSDAAFSGGTLEAMVGDGYTGGKNIDVNVLSFSDGFGQSVSLDGNRLVVGTDDSSGAVVYLFSFTDSVFSGGALEATIGSGQTGGKNIDVTLDNTDRFGYSVSLDGNRLAVGARDGDGFGNSVSGSGEAYLFSFSDADFNGGTLEATIGDGYTGGKNIDVTLDSSDRFGYSVSLDGNRLAVGADQGDGSNTSGNEGEVYLFSFSDSIFNGGTLEALIGDGYTGGKNIDVNLGSVDNFGTSASLDGNRLAIGVPGADGITNISGDSGEVHLFRFSDAAFNGGFLEATIGDGYTGGNNFDINLSASDQFGTSVSLDGNRLAVGAEGGDGFGNALSASGEVYLFSFSDADFNGATLEAIVGNGYTGGKNIDVTLGSSDNFGTSVSLDGNRLAVGAEDGDGFNNSVSNSGDVYLFSFTDAAFSGGTLEAMVGDGYTGGKNIDISLSTTDYFGSAVSLDGNRLAVGARQGDGSNTSGDEGDVYLFSFSDAVFSGGTLEASIGDGFTGGKNINIDLGSSEDFGSSVSLDGNRLAVGAFEGDGFGNSVNGSGEVYLFSFSDADFNGGVLEATIGDGYTGGKNIDVSALDNNDRFGISVSLDGNQLAVGAEYGGGSGNAVFRAGEVYLFSFTDTTFSGGTLETTIGDGYTGGSNIDVSRIDSRDYFGSAVSLDGNRLAVGAREDDGVDISGFEGAVYLFPVASGGGGGATLADNDTFGESAGSDVTITPDDITALLDAGTAVTLQASNDITLDSAVTANNAGGDGGDFTLQAGRSILINADVTSDNGDINFYANDLLANGVVDAHRDAGDAVITVASGVTLDAGTGAINLELRAGTGKTNLDVGDITIDGATLTADTIFARNFSANDDIVLNAGSSLTGANAVYAIELASGRNFFNNAGAGVFTLSGGGNWRTYSTTPTADTLGGLTRDAKRYNCAIGSCTPGLPGTGNTAAYSIAPTLTVTADNETRIYGDANPAFSAQITGFIDGDTAGSAVTGSASISTTATTASDVNTYAITPAAGTLASTLGYQFNYVNGTLTINQAPLTITADDVSRTQGSANPAFTFSYSGFKNSDSEGDLDVLPTATTPAVPASPIADYAINLAGGSDNNYSYTLVDGTLSVAAAGGNNNNNINPIPENPLLRPQDITNSNNDNAPFTDPNTITGNNGGNTNDTIDLLSIAANGSMILPDTVIVTSQEGRQTASVAQQSIEQNNGNVNNADIERATLNTNIRTGDNTQLISIDPALKIQFNINEEDIITHFWN